VTDAEYDLRPVDELSPAARAAVQRIYEDGFPPHQRASFASLIAGRVPGERGLALIRDGQPAGFAMLRLLGGTGWEYLRYFVVDAEQRGHGLGTRLWRLLTGRLRAQGATLLVLDVDDPAEPGCDAAEIAVRTRRIHFYERRGAALLPVAGYRAPQPGAPDDDSWEPLLLITAPLAGDGPPPAPLQVVAAVYQYRWHLDPGHPQIAAVTAAGPAHETLTADQETTGQEIRGQETAGQEGA
jgi:GNAT superfamily N-acetyltransferase